ncbi:MAG: Hpt domain-containing protein [Acidobacteriaceae bacterium]|nr:Hpt domain-containing protein [Acidobacteriaceae bacterium]
MSKLRVLLIESDLLEAATISDALSEADHFVLTASVFDEAFEALSVQRWDAILVSGCHYSETLAQFAVDIRKLEGDSGDRPRTVLVSLAPSGLSLSETGFDAVLARPFDVPVFTRAVTSCAGVRKTSARVLPYVAAESPVFEPHAFAEQVAFDPDLSREIIDLFLEERGEQLAQMSQALAARDLPSVSRIAHTMKGSFGTLHAPRARLRAQELEVAAKEADIDCCGRLLAALEEDVEHLVPELLEHRNS